MVYLSESTTEGQRKAVRGTGNYVCLDRFGVTYCLGLEQSICQLRLHSLAGTFRSESSKEMCARAPSNRRLAFTHMGQEVGSGEEVKVEWGRSPRGV